MGTTRSGAAPTKRVRMLTVLAVFGALASLLHTRRSAIDPWRGSLRQSSSVEDIYVFRSLREERSAPDQFCAASKAGFTAKVQDRYTFRAVVAQTLTSQDFAGKRSRGTREPCPWIR